MKEKYDGLNAINAVLQRSRGSRTCQSRVRSATLSLWFVVIAFMAIYDTAMAGTTVTVGNPSSPNSLNAAINAAYSGGATTIVVAPGTYTLAPSGSIQLNGWSNATLSCYGCTFDSTLGANQAIFSLNDCTNVKLFGGTITCSDIPMWETKITGVNGATSYSVATVPGYPAPPTGTGQYCWLIGGNNREYEAQTGDLRSTITSTGSNSYSIGITSGTVVNAPADGDYVVGRTTTGNGIPYHIWLIGCTSCSVKDVIMLANGFSSIREDSCTKDTLNHDIWAAGPPPPGATDPPLFSCGADGSDALSDFTGPVYENCQMLQLLNDDDIAVHGYTFPLNSVSGTTVTFEDANLSPTDLIVGQTLRFADATFFAQGTITAVSDNDGISTVTLDKNYNIPSDAAVFNPDDCGANYKITNCLLGSTRSRGIIAKADNGWIEGNTILPSLDEAVRVGNDGWSDEAGFANNVDVLDNVIYGPGSYYGALQVGNTGATGNFNYLIENNFVSDSTGPSIEAFGANGVQVSNNIIANTSQYPSSYMDEHVLDVADSTNVTMANNILTNRGPNAASPYYEIDSSSTNINTSGLTTQAANGTLYTLNHYTTNQNIDVPNDSSASGTDIDTQQQAQDTEQCWVANTAVNGCYTLTHLGTGLVMDVPSNSKNPGTFIDQAVYGGGTNDQWSIADQGNGTQTITNSYSGLVVDAYGQGATNGTAIDEYSSNNGNNQRWVTWAAAPAPGPNLVQNFSFEADGGYTQNPSEWTISCSPAVSAYAQQQGISEDGPNCLVFWNAQPYNATVSQTITGLADGYYTLTAYAAGSTNMNQAYMFASNYGTNAPELEAKAPLGSNGMQQITIANIYVSNGQCTIGFYGQTGNTYTSLLVDNVVFTRQFSAPAQVDLTANLNDIGIVADGTTFTNGGFDNDGWALSNNLLGSSQNWDGETFNFGGGLNNYNVVSCDGSTVALPISPYTFSTMYVLAAAVNGAQTNQNFTLNYKTGVPQSITQSFSDWTSPSNFSGESQAVSMSYRDASNGTKSIPVYLYGYAIPLDKTRMPLGINLPINSNLKVVAITLAP